MPTYDYRCTVCGYVFEHFQSMFDEPLKICPRCGSQVRRVISGGTGLIFKGTGFYITDYKNSKSSPVNKSAAEVKSAKAPKKPGMAEKMKPGSDAK